MLKHGHILLSPCFSAGTFHSIQLVGYVLYEHESSNGFPVRAEIFLFSVTFRPTSGHHPTNPSLLSNGKWSKQGKAVEAWSWPFTCTYFWA